MIKSGKMNFVFNANRELVTTIRVIRDSIQTDVVTYRSFDGNKFNIPIEDYNKIGEPDTLTIRGPTNSGNYDIVNVSHASRCQDGYDPEFGYD